MANQAVISHIQIILNSPSDWEDWIEVIRTRALGTEIWEYVDPSTKEDSIRILREPEIPTASTVNSDQTSISKLSEDEKKELKSLHFKYKHDLVKYE